MNKKLEETVEFLKQMLKEYKMFKDIQNEKFEDTDKIYKHLETVLNYINVLETAVNNKYPYVMGGRTLYARLQQCNKEDLIKAYLRLRNETEQLIKENSISKEKVEGAIEKARTKMFSTRVMNEQEMYFLDKCVHVINDTEKEILEGK